MDIIKQIYEWIKNIFFIGNNIAYIKECIEKDALNPNRVRCDNPCCSSFDVKIIERNDPEFVNIYKTFITNTKYKCNKCGNEFIVSKKSIND